MVNSSGQGGLTGMAARLTHASRRVWLQVDPRVLGVMRLGLGLMCVIDVIRRAPYIELLYCGPDSALSDTIDPLKHTWSLLYFIDSPIAVWGFWVFSILCALCFTLGLRTLISHVLTYICILSWHATYYPHNGGDFVLHLMLMWCLFLPMGRCYSADAVSRNDTGATALEPVESLAVLAIYLQFSTIYFFSAVTKWGESWTGGTAIYQFLQLDYYVTPLGHWLRDFVWLDGLWHLLTIGTMVIEVTAPLLILFPFYSAVLRRIALVLLVGLHLGIMLLGNVGLFSPNMMVSLLILLSADDMDRMTGRRARPVPLLKPLFSGRRIAEITVLFVLVINGLNGLWQNQWSQYRLFQAGYKYDEPALFQAIRRATNMRQDWFMFSPDVDGGERRVVVTATTADGQTIDLVTSAAPDYGPNRRNMGFSEFTRKFNARVIFDPSGMRAKRYQQWLVKRWNATHPPEQRVQSVQTFEVFDRSPTRDEDGPTVNPPRLLIK